MFSHGSQDLRSVFCCRKLNTTTGSGACLGTFLLSAVPVERGQVSQRQHQPATERLPDCAQSDAVNLFTIEHRDSNSPILHMTSTRRFTCNDLFHFNGVNLDYFTETVLCHVSQSINVPIKGLVSILCVCSYSTTCHSTSSILPVGPNIA